MDFSLAATYWRLEVEEMDNWKLAKQNNRKSFKTKPNLSKHD